MNALKERQMPDLYHLCHFIVYSQNATFILFFHSQDIVNVKLAFSDCQMAIEALFYFISHRCYNYKN